MYVMCFLLVVLNIDIIFTWIIPAGVRSPRMSSTDSACNVLSTGHVDYDYHNVVPYNSYGRIQSPDTSTDDDYYAWHVMSDGDIVVSFVIVDSYGNLLLHAYIILVK